MDNQVAILYDAAGNPLATAPGTPAAKALTVQGDPAGEPIPVAVENTVGVTGTVAVSSSALPSGAATEATLAAINTKTPALVSGRQPVDGSGVTQPISAAALPLPAGASTSTIQATQQTSLDAIKTAVQGTLAVDASAHAVPVTDNGGSLTVDGSVAITGTPNVAVTSSVLPTGAATETTLATRAADATITARLNTLGQKTSANSAPVVISSDQSSLHTTVDNASLAITAASLPLPTGAATETTLAAINTKTATLVSGRVPVDPSGVTSPVSVAAVVHVDDNGASLTVDTPQLPTTLGAKTIANSTAVNIASDQTVPVSAVALPLPSGAATEATLATRLADATFTSRISTLGQKAMAASTPVVLASDQASIPITAASLPLPTGAATEITLAALSAKVPTLGQAAMAASTPVVIASNQSAVPVSGTVTANQGTAAAAAGAWPVGVTDGVSTAAVKLASTAAAATDPALVVAVSPNSPVVQGAASESGSGITNFAGALQNGRFAQLVKDRDVVEALAEILEFLHTLAATIQPSARPREQLTAPANYSVFRSVTAASSTRTLLDKNQARLGATILNADTASALYVLSDGDATITQYTVKLIPGAYYEMPYRYTGRISGIWDVGFSGSALITEFF